VVEKRYVAVSPGADKGENRDIAELATFIGPRQDHRKFNAELYPPPKYKGAEKQPAPFKRVYQHGPRGGCYYRDRKGKKVYVDKSHCGGK
jgi:hypothetical protein